MNNEDFVTYNQAVKLKELGFDWKCNHYYDIKTKEFLPVDCFNCDGYVDADDLYDSNPPKDIITYGVSVPTLAQSQKWLREKYKLWLEPVICIQNVNHYSCDIYDLKTADEYNYMDSPTTDIEGTFHTPEEALSAGIDKAIEIIKKINDDNRTN